MWTSLLLAGLMTLRIHGPTHCGPPTHHPGGYTYGWPSGQTYEPHVVAQYLFDEASGSIFDKVANVELTPFIESPAQILYQQTLLAPYDGLSPGIKFVWSFVPGVKNSYFHRYDAPWTIAPGDHVVFETWASFPTGTTFVDFGEDEGDDDAIYAQIVRAHDRIYFAAYGAGAYLADLSVSPLPSAWDDGVMHHWRFSLNATTGALKIERDGMDLGGSQNGTWAGHPAMPFVNNEFAVAGEGTYAEWRLSIGTDVLNNNSYKRGLHCGPPTRFP